MTLHLGSEKVKLNFDNTIHRLNIYHSTSSVEGARLLTSDGYTLTDSNNAVLIAEENK